MQRTRRASIDCPGRARGFTYIEMAVVIAIIAILMLIVLQIGRSVADAGRARQTQATLAVLDNALTAYATERPGQFPADFLDSRGAAYPLIDGRCVEDFGASPNTSPAFPSLALFLASARRTDAIDAAIRGIDPSRVISVDMADYSTRFTHPLERLGAAPSDTHTRIAMITVLDGWDRPIRFVHPKYDGGYGNGFRPTAPGAAAFVSVARGNLKLDIATANGGAQATNFRRAAMPFDPSAGGYQTSWTGDGDEGTSPGARAYFYSGGRDGNPGTRGDNVYSIRPNFAADTGTSAQ